MTGESMSVFQVRSEDDTTADPITEHGLAVSLTVAALIGMAFVSTGAWIYFLYRLLAWTIA